MNNYHIGDRLCFVAPYDQYNIMPGDTATIMSNSHHGWCICFDRDIDGHDCNIPDEIPDGHGWWLGGDFLDCYAVRLDESVIQDENLSLDPEEIL